MASLYYIDAYNILHRSAALRPSARQDLESAREALIDKIAQFCVATSQRACVVFDGRHTTKADRKVHASVAGLQIVYTPADLTADSYIERAVYQHKDRLQVAVVSNDRSLRDLCRTLGALTMEADNFLETVRESRQDMEGVIERGKRVVIEHLEDRLDGDSLQKLMELRKKL
jgi:predicted RNA-binding protein with PIN domain